MELFRINFILSILLTLFYISIGIQAYMARLGDGDTNDNAFQVFAFVLLPLCSIGQTSVIFLCLKIFLQLEEPEYLIQKDIKIE